MRRSSRRAQPLDSLTLTSVLAQFIQDALCKFQILLANFSPWYNILISAYVYENVVKFRGNKNYAWLSKQKGKLPYFVKKGNYPVITIYVIRYSRGRHVGSRGWKNWPQHVPSRAAPVPAPALLPVQTGAPLSPSVWQRWRQTKLKPKKSHHWTLPSYYFVQTYLL